MNKPAFPYLVDISITNSCPYQCDFCYQSSILNGINADFDFLSNTLCNVLFKNKVFEVVIGGGEPTLYPDLWKVLKEYKKKHFKVSITTKNYNLHKLPDFEKIIENTDFIAFSCNSLEDKDNIETFIKTVREQKYYLYDKIGIQIILGLQDFNKILELIEDIKKNYLVNHITLLGYKVFGRGKNIIPYKLPEDWIKKIFNLIKSNKEEDMDYLKIGADSVLVSNFKNELIEAGVDSRYLLCKEGISTCFIDAVNYKIKPSSFTEEEVLIDKSLTAKQFANIFGKFI